MQINFAVNKLYNSTNNEGIPKQLQDWIDILSENIKENDLVINFGVSDTNRTPCYHILFGGQKGQEQFSDITNSTVDDLQSVENFYNTLKDNMKEFDMTVVTHNEFGNTNKNHISQVIRKQYNANVISLFVGKNLIQFSRFGVYYRSIRRLVDAINLNLRNS
jgi:hypothetical protein